MKYQVGDTVIVRNDIVENELCYMEDGGKCASYTTTMKGIFGGKAVTIDRIFLGCYHIKEDYGNYIWTDGMFEDILSDKETLISEGPSLLYGWG